MKTVKFSLLLFCLSLLSVPSLEAQRVVVSSNVDDFQTTQLLVGCPAYDGNSALIVDVAGDRFADITDEEADRLIELLTRFDEENGGFIKSRPSVRDLVEIKDKIDFRTTGPLSGAGKALCDFVNDFLGG